MIKGEFMNPVIDVIRNRTSLRKFTNEVISDETKSLLFECGMLAPTAGNQMLYSMIDITDADIKEKLAVACDNQPFIAKAPMVVVYVADHQKWFDYYKMNDVKGFCETKDSLSFEAPQESDLLLACEDAMCAAQNMVIAAESTGIGSCYIGDILENYEYIKELLNLPDWVFPITMVVFGYRNMDDKRRHVKRFDSKFVVFENKYKNLSEVELKEMYKEVDAKFNVNNSVQAKNYAQQFYNRKTGAEFSKEMARSVRVALKKWDGRKL